MKKSLIRAALILTVAMVGLSMLPPAAMADFPEKPITILVGRGAGGATDIVVRTFAPFLSKHIGVPVVVKNMKGAGGRIALAHAFNKVEADGYTLIAGVTPSDLIKQLLKKGDYDLRDFSLIYAFAGGDSNALSVPPDSDIKTLDDLIAKAKKGPISLGGTSIGSNSWLMAVQFKDSVGVNYDYVPYESGSEGNMAIMGGHVDVGVSSSISAAKLVKDSKIRALAVSSTKRLSYMPDTPTFAELGYLEVNTSSLQYIQGPPGLPAGIIATIEKAAAKATADPEYLAKATNFEVFALDSAGLKKSLLDSFESTAAILRKTGQIK